MTELPLSSRLLNAADALEELEEQRLGGKRWVFDIATVRRKAREVAENEAAATLHAAQVTEILRDCLQIADSCGGDLQVLGEELISRGWRKPVDLRDSETGS
ncbi:hypothetical protein NM962_01320 [Mycobacterium sp. SVM_VP21]|nr:hypothetical protein NM962_01320 [Mycobacterium sp. SVM_VP21]